MEIYSKLLKKSFHVDQDQLQLLTMISNLGFVTKKQLHLLWSAIKGYPIEFPRKILSGWSKKGGLLFGTQKTLPHTNRSYFYVPSSNFLKFVEEHNLPVAESAKQIKINTHNLAAVDVVVQGLYTASLKSSLWSLIPSGSIIQGNESGKNNQVPSGRSKQEESGKSNQASLIPIEGIYQEEKSGRNNQIPSEKNKQIPSGKDNQGKEENIIKRVNLEVWSQSIGRSNINFVPDEVIRVDKNIICIELDNRTETTQRQVDKLNNYIRYATLHPEQTIQVIFALNDYSNVTFKSKYISPERKIANQMDAMLYRDSDYLANLKRPIADGLKSVQNLEVYVCGTDEADIAVAEAIHNVPFGRGNWNDKECMEVSQVINEMSYDCSYIGRDELKQTPLGRLITSYFTANERSQEHALGKGNCYFVGVMKVRSEEFDNDKNIYYMPAIAGLEHSLYTQFAIRQAEELKGSNLLYDLQIRANKDDLSIFKSDDPESSIQKYLQEGSGHILASPLVIFPKRERKLLNVLYDTANKEHSSTSNFTTNNISRYSPRYTLSDDPLIEDELTELKDAISLKAKLFFKDEKNTDAYEQGIKETKEYLQYINPNYDQPREFQELSSLAKKLKSPLLADKLYLSEIPYELYKNGYHARNELAHATPILFPQSFKNTVEDLQDKLPENYFEPSNYFYNFATSSNNRFVKYEK